MAAARASSHTGSNTFEFVSKSVEATEQFGEQLGRRLVPGDVVGLMGELGAGKTTLIRGLAKGLELNPDDVKSPTFILLREYPGRVPLIHIDAYRLDGTDAAVVWEDPDWLFSPHKVTVIEWADRVGTWLPDDALVVRVAHKSTNQRSVTCEGRSARAQQLAELMRQQMAQTPLADANPCA